MADRGYEIVNMEGRLIEWKRCEVPDCPHLICARLSPIYCWPHSMMGGEPDPSLAEDVADLQAAT